MASEDSKMNVLHGIIMVKQDEDSTALTYDNQDLASQSLLDGVKEDISQKYVQWIQKLD